MHRRHRFIGLGGGTPHPGLAFVASTFLFFTSMASSGCGGSESSGTTDTDSGPGDTTPAKDTAVADTKPEAAPDTTVDDTTKVYDAPGSLFDAVIPDIAFEGDVTAAGCYDCTLTHCHDQVATCDKDPRCRGFLLCVLINCKASTTDTACLVGCAGDYDVTLGDPIIGTMTNILSCTQANCKKECPVVVLDGGVDAKPTDAPKEASADASDSADAGADAHPILRPHGAEIEPKVIDVMVDFAATFASMPEARDGLVNHLQSIR